MIIDKAFLDNLLRRAAKSDRRRVNYDMRTSNDDLSQRMLNVLLPGTQVPIHRHQETTETIVVLKGQLTEIFYDDNGVECARYDLCPAEHRYALQVPKGMWHTVTINAPCVIFEAKDGAYTPPSPDDFMDDSIVLKAKIRKFMEEEARSCSMEVITPEYIYRMWGGHIPIEEIRKAMP